MLKSYAKRVPPATVQASEQIANELAAQFSRPGRLFSCNIVASDGVSETERCTRCKHQYNSSGSEGKYSLKYSTSEDKIRKA